MWSLNTFVSRKRVFLSYCRLLYSTSPYRFPLTGFLIFSLWKLLGQHKLSLCNTFRINNILSVQQSKSLYPQFPCMQNRDDVIYNSINVLCRTLFMYCKVFMLCKYSALHLQVAVLTSALNYHNYFQKVFLKIFCRKISHSVIEKIFYVVSNISGDRCE